MHLLHLLRHAKSSANDAVEDRERKLSRRGREAAERLARYLPEAAGGIDLALCSSARRTRETMGLVLAGFARRPPILFEDGLYLANAATLIERLRALPEADDEVLLVGHNPGLHELALALAAPGSEPYERLASGKFPTGALASFRIAGRWSAIERTRHPLVDYATPQSLGESED